MTVKRIAALCAVLLAPCLRAQNPDSFTLLDDDGKAKVIRAAILEDGYKKFAYQKAGRSKKEVAASLVSRIKYGGFPTAYKQARAAELKAAKGGPEVVTNLETAANTYELVANTEGTREVIKAYCLYKAATCRLMLGIGTPSQLGAAVTKYQAFLEKHSTHRLALRAILDLAKAQRLAKDFSAAGATLTGLDKKVLDENLKTIWEARSKVEQVRVHLDAGKAQNARTVVGNAANLLAEITTDKAEVATLQLTVDMLKGRCETVDKNYTAAVNYFEGLIGKAGSQIDLKVVGLLGKGEALFRQGAGGGDSKTLRKAQMAFAQAAVLDPGHGDFSAMASYYLGEVTLALGAKAGGSTVAKDYFKEVVRYYPLTDWAAKARKRL